MAVALAAGTALLGATLAVPAGSALFFGLGLLAAAAWIAGALLSGPVPWRHADGRSPGLVGIATPLLLGVGLFGAFVAVKLIADRMPMLSDSVASVLERADAGSRALVLVVALVNAVGEEMFFRGALHSAFDDRHPTASTTLIYTVVTITTLEPGLIAAALVVGLVFSAQRRITGSVLAPILTHVTWSTLVLFFLPR